MGQLGRTTLLLVTCTCCLLNGLVEPAVALPDATGYGYRYVSLDNAKPAGALFVDYFGINTSRNVYGNAFSCDVTCDSTIVVYRNGVTTVLNKGIGYAVNELGVGGGSVVTDPDNFVEQAALFDRTNVQLIPRRPNEATSHVVKVSDTGIALVESVDATTFASTFSTFSGGRSTVVNLGSGQGAFLDINNAGVIGGTLFGGANGARAFRYRPPGPAQKLSPLPTEPESQGHAINSQGDVLGYSYVPGGIERIGRWRDGTFVTSFVEGTPVFPTISNRLLWNEAGLIAITQTNDDRSYIVPRPGVRLNLANLTTGLPAWTLIADMNSLGDLVGLGGASSGLGDHVFLLERTGVRR